MLWIKEHIPRLPEGGSLKQLIRTGFSIITQISKANPLGRIEAKDV